MENKHDTEQIRQQRARAVRTALVLGIIALAIFATFIGTAVIGR